MGKSWLLVSMCILYSFSSINVVMAMGDLEQSWYFKPNK